jgi:hypothetical protein
MEEADKATLAEAADGDRNETSSSGSSSSDRPSVAPSANDTPSVSVSALTRRLEAVKAALQTAQTSLQREAAGASDTSAALADALAQLEVGLTAALALRDEVEAAEMEASLGWFLDAYGVAEPGDLPGDNAEARVAVGLAKLKERLTSTVCGTSTLTLDAEGRLISHVDTLDFDAAAADASADQLATESDSQAPQRVKGGAVSTSNASEFPNMTEEDRATAAADALFVLCLAHQPADTNGWVWRWVVTKHMLWETFTRDSTVDDDIRMQLPREEFDDLVSSMLLSATLGGAICLAVFSYWALFMAPQLPAQLQEAGVPLAVDEAMANVPAALQQGAARLAALLRGPSLFA